LGESKPSSDSAFSPNKVWMSFAIVVTIVFLLTRQRGAPRAI
jgi:hypothetical protein